MIEHYPTVSDLASAPVDEVLKRWQGLGYYSRARNLHATAQQIVKDHKGEFPGHYHELIRLKGIGSYTAAAIASIAFNEPVALVDGNVYRVLSRLFGIEIPVDTPAGKRIFQERADSLLDHGRPGMHNQALMEFGALVCLPKNPGCPTCILAGDCLAYREGKTGRLPMKKGKAAQKIRYFNYLFIRYLDFIYLHQRNSRDIWQALYEFPLIETEAPKSFRALKKLPDWKALFGEGQITLHPFRKTYRHQLTHQVLCCSFYPVSIDFRPETAGMNLLEIPAERIHEYAVPRVIDKYINELYQEGLL
jgi:A/G-specific adenine glycosylase